MTVLPLIASDASRLASFHTDPVLDLTKGDLVYPQVIQGYVSPFINGHKSLLAAPASEVRPTLSHLYRLAPDLVKTEQDDDSIVDSYAAQYLPKDTADGSYVFVRSSLRSPAVLNPNNHAGDIFITKQRNQVRLDYTNVGDTMVLGGLSLLVDWRDALKHFGGQPETQEGFLEMLRIITAECFGRDVDAIVPDAEFHQPPEKIALRPKKLGAPEEWDAQQFEVAEALAFEGTNNEVYQINIYLHPNAQAASKLQIGPRTLSLLTYLYGRQDELRRTGDI